MENFSYVKDFDDSIEVQRDFEMDLAVNIKSVQFYYRKNAKILNNLSLQIPKGKIFALLGPNGCGKTTLIRSILGRLQLKRGYIKVFNNRPGSKYSDIPGKGVGYMPQELALFEEFTIKEILTYYGLIYHMEREELLNRIANLCEILNLPETSRPISRLSGGQQRRVSIAVTMIHSPKLIILDEPTVGVDSLLRCRIWQYLEYICHTFGQTVLITTHYIEEAKTAANVAFMNSGTVLRQSNPQKLLNEFQCKTLEEVFLILCQNSRSKKKPKHTKEIDSNFNDSEAIGEKIDCNIIEENSMKFANSTNDNNNNDYNHNNYTYNKKAFDFIRIKAMIWKYYILTMRRPLFLFLFYVLPLLVLSVMKFSIGQKPHNIPVAVFNGDLNPRLSQLFIDSIDQRYLHTHEYQDNQTAFDSVQDGTNRISIVFTKNFTDTFELRLTDVYQMTEEELDLSSVKLYADFSDSIVGNLVYNSVIKAFEAFLRRLSSGFGHNLYRYFFPITVEPAIYGDVDLNLNNYISPGLMMALAHIFPMVISAFQIIYDRKNTSMERVFVTGVQPIEFFIAHMIQNLFLVITWGLITMFVAFVILNNYQIGSYFEVYLLFVLQGVQGIAIGLCVALILFDEISVGIGITALMLPLWIMSGVIWPSEAIPYQIRYLTDLGPLTQPLDGLRSIMLRGWSYTRPNVLAGYIISVIYTVVVSILNIILFCKYNDKALNLNFFRP